jgi:hypothetical protein
MYDIGILICRFTIPSLCFLHIKFMIYGGFPKKMIHPGNALHGKNISMIVRKAII